MGILTQTHIIELLNEGKLIKNARKKENGEFDVEAASYDLSIGTAVSKKHNKKPFQKKHETLVLDDPKQKKKQKNITLSPGQMVFVVTHEEVMLPDYICATVYSRNSLAQKGILALNAGHIDPGFFGPITIKLINLRSVDYTLSLGEPIFTIVFESIDKPQYRDSPKRVMSKEETLKRVNDATDLSLDNALYDLALLREFVKEGEFGKAYWKWIKRSFWGIVTVVLSLIGAAYALVKLYELLTKLEMFK
jgi:deoxycytidine triphosphate deaminase